MALKYKTKGYLTIGKWTILLINLHIFVDYTDFIDFNDFDHFDHLNDFNNFNDFNHLNDFNDFIFLRLTISSIMLIMSYDNT